MEVGVSLGQTVPDVVYLARFQKNGAHPSHRVTHQKQCARPVQIPFSSNRFGLRALFRYAVAFFITMVSGGGCIRAGPGGCYADGPVRHHRELSKSNFPPGLVWQWRNRWNPAAGDTSHSWTVRKMSKIRGSEISSVAANESDILFIRRRNLRTPRTSRVCDRDEGTLFPSRVDRLADPKRRRDRR